MYKLEKNTLYEAKEYIPTDKKIQKQCLQHFKQWFQIVVKNS